MKLSVFHYLLSFGLSHQGGLKECFKFIEKWNFTIHEIYSIYFIKW
jgi:hypothetical protein